MLRRLAVLEINMNETQMTEAPRNIWKAVLTYVALASIAILSVIVYLILGTTQRNNDTVKEKEPPWDFLLTSVIALDEDDLNAVRALDGVDRIEKISSTELHLWMSGTAENRTAYEEAAASAEREITLLADERESARVEILQREARTEPDTEALAELEALREKLDAEAQRLALLREKLDGEQAALRQRQAQLDAVRTELNRDGYALDEAEAGISAWTGEIYRDEMRHHHEQRDAWYAEGEDYLDAFTLFTQETARLEKAESAYASDLAAWKADNDRMEELRRKLEIVPEPPQIEDCTWRLERNLHAPEFYDSPEEKTFSPLRLAIRMLFLGIAAMAVWFFFARLLSSVAGSITKSRPAPKHDASRKASIPANEEDVAVATKRS